MNIVFRTDASLKIGTGHVMRCLTLAKSLRDRRCTCRFISRGYEGNLIEKIISEGFLVSVLENSNFLEVENDQPILDHSDWLGTSWQQDAMQSIEAIGSDRIDWLVVDHYALDIRWEGKLRPYTKKIMVIDDLADREHSCDLLLDQNLGREFKHYQNLVSSTITLLLGPKFALLDPIFPKNRLKLPKPQSKINRLLMYFGGGQESTELAKTVLKAFSEEDLLDFKVDLVLQSKEFLSTQLDYNIKKLGSVRVHYSLPNLASLMMKANLSIGAAGSTTWERCCLGLPSLLVVCSLNQKLIGESMESRGAALTFYQDEKVGQRISKAVFKLLDDHNFYLQMRENALKICDGSGTDRVARTLLEKSCG